MSDPDDRNADKSEADHRQAVAELEDRPSDP